MHHVEYAMFSALVRDKAGNEAIQAQVERLDAGLCLLPHCRLPPRHPKCSGRSAGGQPAKAHGRSQTFDSKVCGGRPHWAKCHRVRLLADSL